MSTTATLVSIEHQDGTAGVARDAEGTWLSGYLGEGATLLTDHRPVVEGLSERRTVEGGLLPPGAVAAEVVDDLGNRRAAAAENGAWVIVLDQPTLGDPSPVRFIDEHGETLAPQLPADWPRSAVIDAEEACPACGACAWDEVRPLDESRGMRSSGSAALPMGVPGFEPDLEELEWEPTPLLVCRVCGHEESMGTWYGPSSEEDADPAEAERSLREFERERRRAERETLARTGFPIYAAEGLEARLTGWGGGSTVNRATVTHHGGPGAQLSIETRSSDALYGTAGELALEALDELLREDVEAWPEGSDAARTIWLHAREREDRARRRRLMAEAEVRPRELSVDGSPETFELVEAGGRWAAVRRWDESAVIVSSAGVPRDEVRLVSRHANEWTIGDA